MVEWKCCEKCRGTKDNPTICMACPEIKIEAEEKLAMKDKDIERLCFLLQMIHDKVPRGTFGFHKVIEETLAQYSPPLPSSEVRP